MMPAVWAPIPRLLELGQYQLMLLKVILFILIAPLTGWQAPIDYKLSTVASLFGVPSLFSAELRSMLPRAQQALEAFIAGCGYMDSSLPDSAAFLAGRSSACPPLPKGDCVQGDKGVRFRWNGIGRCMPHIQV